MHDTESQSGRGVRVAEPFLGTVWLDASRAASMSDVRVVVSVEKGWDVDILIGAGDATALADALGADGFSIVRGQTADGEPAVLVVDNDRLAITVPRARLSDVLSLGRQVEAVRECLRAAATA
jgi:hypothetical protein